MLLISKIEKWILGTDWTGYLISIGYPRLLLVPACGDYSMALGLFSGKIAFSIVLSKFSGNGAISLYLKGKM